MFTEQIERGAALLDERGPARWRDRVDPAQLDVDDPTRCVLGQVYANDVNVHVGLPTGFTVGLVRLDAVGLWWEWAEWFGFTPVGDDVAESTLNAEWRAYLERTR